MRINIKKDCGGHDFIQVEWFGVAANRSTVRKHIIKGVEKALAKIGKPIHWASSYVPDYYEHEIESEISDSINYDGENKRNGFYAWDETRSLDGKFRYVYFGFSVC